MNIDINFVLFIALWLILLIIGNRVNFYLVRRSFCEKEIKEKKCNPFKKIHCYFRDKCKF